MSCLIVANIQFSFGFKETAPIATLMAASQPDLIALFGLFDIMLEMISWFLQLGKYSMVLMSMGFLLMGALPFYRESGEYILIYSLGKMLLKTRNFSGVSGWRSIRRYECGS